MPDSNNQTLSANTIAMLQRVARHYNYGWTMHYPPNLYPVGDGFNSTYLTPESIQHLTESVANDFNFLVGYCIRHHRLP